MQKYSSQSEKMGKAPVGRLLITMSLPAIFSMLVQALYNIVDSMYVSGIGGVEGEKSLDAVSIAFPFQMLSMAFAFGVAIGTGALISRKLGEGDPSAAKKLASTGLVLAVINCLFFVLLGALVPRYIGEKFADDPVTALYVKRYLSVAYLFSIGMYIEIFINKILQAANNMLVPMFSQIIGAVTNIILDYIFIFVFCWGVLGAAYATVIGQGAACVFSLIMFFAKKREVGFDFKKFRLKWQVVGMIYRIGLPSIVLNSISSFTTLIMNVFLRSTEYGISILGVYFKLNSFVFMPIFGLNQGLMPLLAYNYGANEKERFVKAFRMGMIFAFAVVSVGFVIFQTMPQVILKMYKSIYENPAALQAAEQALRKISLCFIPAGFSIVTITMYQSVGHGVKAMLMSVFRQLVFLLPFALIVYMFFDMNYIWYAYPFAELIVAVVFVPLGIKTVKTVFESKNRQLANNTIAA